jgi:hypothetical protein
MKGKTLHSITKSQVFIIFWCAVMCLTNWGLLGVSKFARTLPWDVAQRAEVGITAP